MTAKRTGPVAGVVLAAGTSTRMGRNKLLFELEGQTLLERSVSRAIAAGLDPVIVVLGHEAEQTRRVLAGLDCHPVVNTEYAQGINYSMRFGIAQVPLTAAGAMVVLADMPFVDTRMIETLIGRYRESKAPLVISQYGDVNAPPHLYDRSLFAELGATQGKGCGKHVVRRHRSEALVCSWPESRFTDVDVPEDYERAKTEIASG